MPFRRPALDEAQIREGLTVARHGVAQSRQPELTAIGCKSILTSCAATKSGTDIRTIWDHQTRRGRAPAVMPSDDDWTKGYARNLTNKELAEILEYSSF